MTTASNCIHSSAVFVLKQPVQHSSTIEWLIKIENLFELSCIYLPGPGCVLHCDWMNLRWTLSGLQNCSLADLLLYLPWHWSFWILWTHTKLYRIFRSVSTNTCLLDTLTFCYNLWILILIGTYISSVLRFIQTHSINWYLTVSWDLVQFSKNIFLKLLFLPGVHLAFIYLRLFNNLPKNIFSYLNFRSNL